MTHVVVRRYIIPNLSDVGDNEKAVLSAAVFVGMLVGGVVCGVLGDKIGRKPCLLYSLALNAVFGFASAFAPHWWWLVVFRVMAGIGVGGSVPSVFTLFAEYLPVHKRGSMLTAVAWFWMVGSIFAAGLAWIVLGWLQHSWRLYAMFAAIPSTSACLLTLVVLPESPRFCANKVRGYAGWVWNHVDLGRVRVHVGWCYTQGDLRKATRLLAGIAARCGVSPMQNRLVLSASNKAKPEPFMKLFHPSIRKDTILLCVIWFTLSFGWYGLILWIPSLFQQVSTLVARTSGCRYAHAAGGLQVHFHLNPYQDSFMVAAANLPGNIASTLLMDTLGRKRVLGYSMGISAAFAVLFAFSTTAWMTVGTACLLNAFSIAGWNSVRVGVRLCHVFRAY